MFEDLTLFAMAQRSMDYSARRESILSQNVANSNTPEYKAKDLAPLNFKDLMGPQPQAIRAATTDPLHISPETEPVKFETVTDKSPDESKPDGNSVSPEEQMQKIGDVNASYNLAINLFMKNINMLKIAIERAVDERGPRLDDLTKSSLIATSGMKAQAERIRIVSENMANADSLPASPDDTPYRRKTISFRNVLDRNLGADMVKVKKIDVDRSEFQKKYDRSIRPPIAAAMF